VVKKLRNLLGIATCLLLIQLTTAVARAQRPMELIVDTKHPGVVIPSDYAGLSFETQMVLPDNGGKHYFSPNNAPLIALFRQLGISSLRIGGNTADRPTVPIPGTADIDQLFAFARAAEVKVIYTLRLRAGDRDQAAGLAKYIQERYRPLLECFAIGNEPNVFAKEYDVYRDEWRNYFATITSSTNAPDARFCGPSATPGRTAWARDFAHDFGASGHLAFISQHDYPGGAGNRATNTVAARERMLSAAWLGGYQKFYDSFVPAVRTNGLRYRLEEANNFFNGGAAGVSDTFASALWGLDYLHWWAAHGAAGINFHTGDKVAAGERMNPCRYASFVTSDHGYNVRPIGYGIKAFTTGSRGRVLPIAFPSDPTSNLTAYAVLTDNQNLFVTVINKELSEKAPDVVVEIAAGEPYSHGSVMFLAAPNRDVAAGTGIALGGATIGEDGSWDGKWSELPAPKNGRFSIRVPRTTAVIARFEIK
jgi:hypothetical protein